MSQAVSPALPLPRSPARSPAEHEREQRATVRSAGVVAATTLLSRVLGMLRDVAAAALFGAGWVWDAFVLAFLLPNLFRRLFGEGSLSAAFVPIYTRVRETHGDAAAARLTSNALTALVLFLAALAALAITLGLTMPDGAWELLFGTTGSAKLDLFRLLLPVLMPFVVLICATALIGGALNVHGRFFVPAFAPVLLNLVWLAGIGLAVWLVPATRPELQCLVVAGAVLLGGTLGLAHHLFALRRAWRASTATATATNPADHRQPHLATRLDTADPHVRDIASRMGPAILGLGVLQLSVLLDSLIAEMFVPGDGAVSALYFGNRLMQFPLALIGVAMGIAVFPVLARHAVRDDHARLRHALAGCTRLTLFLALPASVGLSVLADPIIGAVYGWGAFDADAQERTATVLACYSLGLVAASLRMLQTRAFYAIGDTRTPTHVAVRIVVLNLVLNVVFVHTPLAESGLALSTSLTGWIGWAWLHRRLSTAIPAEAVADTDASLVPSLLRNLLASAAMAAAALGVGYAITGSSGPWHTLSPVLRLLSLGGVIAAAVAVFAAVAVVLRAPELRQLLLARRR